MSTQQIRRADFLMALAYATDLATGHSRDFALRSCVLAMRLAEVAGLDERYAPQRLSSGAAALHRLQCRHASAGGGLGRRDRAAPELASHRHGQPGGIRRDLRPRHHAQVRRTRRPRNWPRRSKRGLAEGPAGEHSRSCPATARSRKGSPSASACRRRSAKISARSTSAGTARDCRAVCRATP